MNSNNLKTRVIPIILVKDGIIVRSKKFSQYQVVGNPFAEVERFNSWNVDELIYLDITREGRLDIDSSQNVIASTSAKKRYIDNPPKDIYEFIAFLSRKCFMPLTFGGGIKDIDTIRKILKLGADKVCINTCAFYNPGLISQAAEEFGSQSIIVSIDVKKTDVGNEVFVNRGKESTGVTVEEWAEIAEDRGAGELLINSIDRDGMGVGCDVSIYEGVLSKSSVPVIICGGIGNVKHFTEAYETIKPHAIAAANIFHFIEHSDMQIKKNMQMNGIDVRTTNKVRCRI